MINQSMSPEERKNILDAAESHIRTYSAIISQVDGSGSPFIGSATCVEIGNRLFLATTAHNFKVIQDGGKVAVFSGQKASHPPLTLIGSNYSQYGDAGTLDLAWIELELASASRSKLSGLPLSSFDARHCVQDSLCYTIAGFPAERAEFHMRNGELNLTCEAVMFITIPATPDPGDDALCFEYPDDAVSLDGPSVPHPGGMSGGGVWATPIKDTALIWAPNFQVVAITTDYYSQSRRIRAFRIHQWLEFLLLSHPELSEHIGGF